MLKPCAAPAYFVDCPIEFAGYVDDLDRAVVAMKFSLDGGASWAAYPTAEVDKRRGANWRFVYTLLPEGRYLLYARVVTDGGQPSNLAAGFAFEVLPFDCPFGSARIRPVSGLFRDARVFRSCELSSLSPEEATFLGPAFGIAVIYDLHTHAELAARPEPYIVSLKTIDLVPFAEHSSERFRRVPHRRRHRQVRRSRGAHTP